MQHVFCESQTLNFEGAACFDGDKANLEIPDDAMSSLDGLEYDPFACQEYDTGLRTSTAEPPPPPQTEPPSHRQVREDVVLHPPPAVTRLDDKSLTLNDVLERTSTS